MMSKPRNTGSLEFCNNGRGDGRLWYRIPGVLAQFGSTRGAGAQDTDMLRLHNHPGRSCRAYSVLPEWFRAPRYGERKEKAAR